jgi:hypothetical protein
MEGLSKEFVGLPSNGSGMLTAGIQRDVISTGKVGKYWTYLSYRWNCPWTKKRVAGCHLERNLKKYQHKNRESYIACAPGASGTVPKVQDAPKWQLDIKKIIKRISGRYPSLFALWPHSSWVPPARHARVHPDALAISESIIPTLWTLAAAS